MSAAVAARRHGLEVTVIDDQAGPGGQIWRSIEEIKRQDRMLGPSYAEGRPIAEAFLRCGATYLRGAQLWELEGGFRAFISRDQCPEAVEAKAVILGTGAQERPVPFQGWTLPGVLTVGAAQILLKTAGEIPSGPLWIAGSGPLPLLYISQLLAAGGRISGYLDTTPEGQWRSALPHLPAALRAWRDLAKGFAWRSELRRSGTPVLRGVVEVEGIGDGRLESVRYRTAQGASATVEAGTLLVHEGVVPNIHAPLSLDCKVEWLAAQDCFAPVLDQWGESSVCDLFIAGDGAGIGGAKAAVLRGQLAALRIATKLGHLTGDELAMEARPVQRKLRRELAMRPFLDAMFRPRRQVFAPADETVVCRCEEITAGDIRAMAAIGLPGPNQIKAASRAGMGPCQGRQCGYTVSRLIAEVQRRSPADVGFYRIRPPLKPVTLEELAKLDEAGGA
jgi:NADPH-dependent 2,4-dienoyl-CoA reductase/sulfur reductase-like enzyme